MHNNYYKYSNYHFSHVFETVGTNAKPMESSVSGIYSDGTSSNTVQSGSNGGYLCYNEFTQDEGQVVCLNWGFLPYVIISIAFFKRPVL